LPAHGGHCRRLLDHGKSEYWQRRKRRDAGRRLIRVGGHRTFERRGWDRWAASAGASQILGGAGGASGTAGSSGACYTDLGAKGASTSNISGGPGVASVLSYMVDSGNETTFGHRRIVLSNELGPIGLGSAGKGGSSCMQNIGGTGKATKAWQAWPPPGPFPIQAYSDVYKRSLDDTGWSIQSKGIDLSAAQVTVTSGGQAQAVKVEQLTGNYGNNKAIRIVPSGWKAAAGSNYAVNVSGIATPISYEIQLIDCK